jgi:hypothetical protein
MGRSTGTQGFSGAGRSPSRSRRCTGGGLGSRAGTRAARPDRHRRSAPPHRRRHDRRVPAGRNPSCADHRRPPRHRPRDRHRGGHHRHGGSRRRLPCPHRTGACGGGGIRPRDPGAEARHHRNPPPRKRSRRDERRRGQRRARSAPRGHRRGDGRARHRSRPPGRRPRAGRRRSRHGRRCRGRRSPHLRQHPPLPGLRLGRRRGRDRGHARRSLPGHDAAATAGSDPVDQPAHPRPAWSRSRRRTRRPGSHAATTPPTDPEHPGRGTLATSRAHRGRTDRRHPRHRGMGPSHRPALADHGLLHPRRNPARRGAGLARPPPLIGEPDATDRCHRRARSATGRAVSAAVAGSARYRTVDRHRSARRRGPVHTRLRRCPARPPPAPQPSANRSATTHSSRCCVAAKPARTRPEPIVQRASSPRTRVRPQQ